LGKVTITDQSIVVRLGPLEAVGTLRSEIRVPRSAIQSVEIVRDALAAVEGWRLRPRGVDLHKVGTWYPEWGKEFVDVRRDQYAVRIRLEGHEFSSLLLGVDDPVAVRKVLRRP
jgi:hypothetical protein